nr:hypothetical protein [Tanacetum cinerariifolium]
MQRFGSPYDDPMGDIKNLRHIGSIEEYQNAFDRLLSRIDLPEDQQVSCYIAGLQNDVEMAVRMFRPKTLAEVYHLSKVQEAAIKVNNVIDHDEEVVHEEVTGEVIEFTPQIYLNALNGVESFQTLKGRKVALRGTRKSCLQRMEGSKDLAQPAQLSSMVLCVYPSTALNMKDAIEIMVKELLESRVIRPSQSPFSSSIVMVKKKDGTWRIPDLSTHVKHLELVLLLLKRHTLFAKQSKCVFGSTRVEYLGHVITGAGVATDDTKIEAMKHWPIPSNLKQLRGFLGLTGYYRSFIKGYALISQPLTKLLKKNAFVWTKEAQSAFVHLKEAMVNAPVLKLPDFNEPFIIETDASGEGIGAVLQQSGHPIAYYSKILVPRHKSLSTYEKELLAVIQALHKWRGYLLDRHFIIKTDHFSLKYLLEQRITTPAPMKWLPKLMRFDYEIVFKMGIENGAADALSRVDTGSQLLSMVLTSVTTDLLPQIMATWSSDPSLITLITNLQAGKPCSKHYSWSNQQLIRKGKLVAFRYWRKIKKQVKEFVSMCAVCQRSKPDLSAYPCLFQPLPIPTLLWSDISMDFVKGLSNSGGKTVIMRSKPDLSAYPGLFQPLPIPTLLWSDISMDFVKGLSSSGGKTVIMVVVDRLSKYSHFMALSHPFTAIQVAQLCMTGEKPKECAKWLSLAEYWYNTNFHTSINTTPFEAVYGQTPTSPILDSPGQSKVDSMDRSLAINNCSITMVATRNTSIKPIVETHVQNWVNNQINAQLTRFREEVTVTIQNTIVVALSGPAGDAMRRNDEGTRRGTQPQFTRMTKIEFPKFGGDDVRGWLFKCEQLFKIDHVLDPHKVQLALIYLYDTASLWHRQFVKLMGESASWNSFKEAIMQGFGSPYDDPMGDIKDLRHTGSIEEYQNAFDRLLSRIDFPEDQQVSCYIVGLQNDVEMAVRMFRPKTLAEVYHLSKV